MAQDQKNNAAGAVRPLHLVTRDSDTSTTPASATRAGSYPKEKHTAGTSGAERTSSSYAVAGQTSTANSGDMAASFQEMALVEPDGPPPPAYDDLERAPAPQGQAEFTADSSSRLLPNPYESQGLAASSTSSHLAGDTSSLCSGDQKLQPSEADPVVLTYEPPPASTSSSAVARSPSPSPTASSSLFPVRASPESDSTSTTGSGLQRTLSALRPSPVLPPDGFSRAPPAHLSFESFAPMHLLGKGRQLDKAFAPLPPPGPKGKPHPFETHDVQPADWVRLIEDIRKEAKLSPKQRIVSRTLPRGLLLPVTGALIGRQIEKRMRKKNLTPTGQIIDIWNHQFFNPRGIEVILARGGDRVNGLETPPRAWESECARLGLQPAPTLKSSGKGKKSEKLARNDDGDDGNDFESLSVADDTSSTHEEGTDAGSEAGTEAGLQRHGSHSEVQEKVDKVWRLFVIPVETDQ